MIAEITAADYSKAISNCYPTKVNKLFAMIYYKNHNEFPFNPQLN